MHGRTFIGILLVILGAGFLLDKMDVIQLSTLIPIYWPIFLILIGASQLLSKGHSTTSGVALSLIGIFFLLKNLGLLPADLGKYFWPVLLIIIGLIIILRHPRPGGVPTNSDDAFNHFVIFSGMDSKYVSQNFKGGNATAVFGGIELDLRDAGLSKDGAFLDLTAAFGGIEIKVPEDWTVIVKGTPIFGAWENKARGSSNAEADQPVLNVRCLAMFGGIEIRN